MMAFSWMLRRYLQVALAVVVCLGLIAYSSHRKGIRVITDLSLSSRPGRSNGDPRTRDRVPLGRNDTRGFHPGGFYAVDGIDVYIYSGFWDDRLRRSRVRFFGMHANGSDTRNLVCNFYVSDEIKVRVPLLRVGAIYPYWPSAKLKFLAYTYECALSKLVPSYSDIEAFSVLVDGRTKETFIPLSHVGTGIQRKELAICVKGIWGNVDPTRLVEWIEFNRLIGVQKIVFYDTTTVGPAVQVLEHYVSTGFADVIQYTYALHVSSLMQDDPMRRHLVNDGMIMEQTYLVSTNDCLYRYRDGYKYIALVDFDEIIVPSNQELLPSVIQRGFGLYPKASCFSFSTAWHFEAFGPVSTNSSTPPYLHMQNYLRRTPVLPSQPKGIVITDNFVTVNWHSVIIMPVGFEGNKFLPWEKYAYVHHFRKKCKYVKEKCKNMLNNSEIDHVIPRYKEHISELVLPVLKKLDLVAGKT